MRPDQHSIARPGDGCPAALCSTCTQSWGWTWGSGRTGRTAACTFRGRASTGRSSRRRCSTSLWWPTRWAGGARSAFTSQHSPLLQSLTVLQAASCGCLRVPYMWSMHCPPVTSVGVLLAEVARRCCTAGADHQGLPAALGAVHRL